MIHRTLLRFALRAVTRLRGFHRAFALQPALALTAAAFSCGLLLLAGCSSTRQIETSPPQTIDAAEQEDDRPTTQQARLTVSLEQGETALPDDIERFEFRIAEVRLHETGGGWIRLPSDVHHFTLPLPQRSRRVVLDTQIAPAAYDSVALTFDRLFARFSENAGAPLTAAAGDEPLRLALNLSTSLDTRSAVTFQFEPGASLRRAPDCRWFFVPTLRAVVE